MSEENRHIIEKVAIEIDVNSMEQAHEIEKEIQTFVKQKIIPEIERYFEAINRPDLHLQMDRISLNFDKGILTNPFWQTDLQKQLQKEFEEPLAIIQEHDQKDHFSNFSFDGLTRNDIEIRSLERSDLSALNHFLITGNAPWWISTSSKGMQQILSEENILSLLERQSAIGQLEQLFKLQPVARKRWIHQFSTTLQLAMFQRLSEPLFKPSNTQQKYISEFVESSIFTGISKQEQHKIWFALLSAASKPERFGSQGGKTEIVQHLVNKFVQNTPSELRKKLNQMVAEIVQGKENNQLTIGELPPILFFALSLVVELSYSDQKIAQQTARKTQQATFEVIDINNSVVEWITTISTSSNDPIQGGAKKNNLKDKLSDTSTAPDQGNFDENAIENGKDQDHQKVNDIDDKNLDQKEISDQNETEIEKAEVEKAQEDAAVKTEFEKSLDEDWSEKNVTEAPVDGEYIDNAGILLMHPFFAPLFKNLGLLDENKQFINPHKAVQLLHFMTTGELECYEYELQFAKFLCGLPSDEVMDKAMVISDKEREEVENVLHSALEYWKSLKSSSIPLLQHEFLKRPGKLFNEGDTIRVVVEQKTVDILMNDLPWGISILRLPWLEDMIYVDWN